MKTWIKNYYVEINYLYIVHFSHRDDWSSMVEITVYSGSEASEVGSGVTEIYYTDNENGGLLKDTKGAEVLFEATFQWRGVWEGRIYFKQEEYFHEDLELIYKVWGLIQSDMEEYIKTNNPQFVYN